jgi:hypothetical protein
MTGENEMSRLISLPTYQKWNDVPADDEEDLEIQIENGVAIPGKFGRPKSKRTEVFTEKLQALAVDQSFMCPTWLAQGHARALMKETAKATGRKFVMKLWPNSQ